MNVVYGTGILLRVYRYHATGTPRTAPPDAIAVQLGTVVDDQFVIITEMDGSAVTPLRQALQVIERAHPGTTGREVPVEQIDVRETSVPTPPGDPRMN